MQPPRGTQPSLHAVPGDTGVEAASAERNVAELLAALRADHPGTAARLSHPGGLGVDPDAHEVARPTGEG